MLKVVVFQELCRGLGELNGAENVDDNKKKDSLKSANLSIVNGAVFAPQNSCLKICKL